MLEIKTIEIYKVITWKLLLIEKNNLFKYLTMEME